MTERDKLLSGLAYDTRDADVWRLHMRARKLLRQYNSSDPEAAGLRASLLRELLGRLGEGNCTVLDGGQVRIGNDVLLGPAVHIYAVSHPVQPEERFLRRDDGTVGYVTTTAPVVIEDRVWIGGNTVVMPGVNIGEGSTVGAGSVVTPPDFVSHRSAAMERVGASISRGSAPPSASRTPSTISWWRMGRWGT